MNEENIQSHKFKRGVSGNPNGRPKRIISKFVADGYTKSEISNLITQLLALSLDQLEEISKDKQSTSLEASIASAIIKDYKKGSLDIVETIISRRYGKSKEIHEITTAPELLAARNLFFRLIHAEKLPQDEALAIVLKAAEDNGFQLDADKILSSDTIE